MPIGKPLFIIEEGVIVGKGNKPLKKKEVVLPETLRCICCDNAYAINEFYSSDSEWYASFGKVPYCRACLDKFYQDYLKKYKDLKYLFPERKAVERICMTLDLFYSDKIFDLAVKASQTKVMASLISLYFQQVKLYQHRNKDYNTTIQEKYKNSKDENVATSVHTDKDAELNEEVMWATKFFGNGFENDDYLFLSEQYKDWTTRHECETKSQEEMFKQICFTQLELLKATRAKMDTKDLNATFLKQLEAAKLQPKQNSGETVSDAQTFGTLIDKWENTRPIPEIDEDLRDVDKIGLYLDVFFRGHLAKMMGLKNAISNLYTKFMKKYTVEKPEYNDDEEGEALFDSIFGNASLED